MTTGEQQEYDRRSEYREIVDFIVADVIEHIDLLIYEKVSKEFDNKEAYKKEDEIWLQVIQALKTEFLYNSIVKKRLI